MTTRTLLVVLGLLLVGALAVGGVAVWLSRGASWTDTYEVEHTDYRPPEQPPDEVLADDRLEDKKPPAFDPALVDRRPLGGDGGWLLNASAAVVRLDVPVVKPDREPDLLTLHPSYAAAAGPPPPGGGRPPPRP